MSNSNKKNKANNARKLEYILSIAFAVIGGLGALLLGFNPMNWGETLVEILLAVSIELVASSLVVFAMMLFSNKNENSGNDELKDQIAQLQNEVHLRIDEQYELMELLNSCIKEKDCKSRLVSEYIFGSGELSAGSSSAEYHILSDELKSYDFTAISTLAIANNINRDNKYVYYLSEDKICLFDELKARVRHYLKRDDTFKGEMEKWIRKTWIENKQLKIEFYETLGVAINNIIEAYFKFSEKESGLKNELYQLLNAFDEQQHGTIYLPESVKNWLSIKSYDEEELAQFAKKVDAIIEFSKINTDNIVKANQKGNEVLYVLKMFSVMYHFSRYMLYGEDLDEDSKKIIFDPKVFVLDQDVAELQKQKKNIEVLKNWITGKTTIGNDAIIDKKISDNLLCINLGCKPRIKLCYSFCLYVHSKILNGNEVTTAEMSWYACNEAFEIAKGQVTEEIVDTVMFIYTPQKDVDKTRRLYGIFEKLISDNHSAKTQLKKHNSKYLNLSKEAIT